MQRGRKLTEEKLWQVDKIITRLKSTGRNRVPELLFPEQKPLVELTLTQRLELEVVACMMITEVKTLFREVETKIDDLFIIADRLNEL
jgi:hypothetical protein